MCWTVHLSAIGYTPQPIGTEQRVKLLPNASSKYTYTNSNKIRVMGQLLSECHRQLISFERGDLPGTGDEVTPARDVT